MELTKNIILSTSYKVTTAETDMYGRLRPSALTNMLIQSAISSADELGFGLRFLNEMKLFWVLSRLEVEIYQPINWYDEVVVETWPKDIKSIFYLRDFFVKNKKGDIIAKATSAWLAVDMKTKRPKIINDETSKLFTRLKDKYAIDRIPEKIDASKSDDKMVINTTYFDVDINRHITSTRYVDWMFDFYDMEFHKNHYPEIISINYLKETMLGDQIELMKNHDGETAFFIGANVQKGKEAFRGRIKFKTL